MFGFILLFLHFALFVIFVVGCCDFTLFTSAKVPQVVGCLSHGFQDSIPAIS